MEEALKRRKEFLGQGGLVGRDYQLFTWRMLNKHGKEVAKDWAVRHLLCFLLSTGLGKR
jgi:hypothetical protein